MPQLSLAGRLLQALRAGHLPKREDDALSAELRELAPAKRRDGARLLDLFRHDGELSRDEAAEAKRLARALGVEATRLPAGVPQCNLDLRHLELDADLRQWPAMMRATYVLGRAHDGEAILDASAERLRILGVTVDGRPVPFSHAGNRLRFTQALLEGSRISIHYAATATSRAEAYGMLRARGAAVAQLWPEHFAKVIPGDSRPGKTLTADLTVRVPPGTVVAAAGAPVSAEGGVYRHRLTTPTPQYAISFAAIDGGEVVRDAQADIAFVGQRAPTERAKRERMISVARHTLAFMRGWFGDSPFGAVHQIAEIPSALGGMEIAQSIQVARGNTRNNADAAEVVTHEIIHHWFGNGVRIKHAADLWLSEGFTTYLTWRAEEARAGQERWDELVGAGVTEARAALAERRKDPAQYPLRPQFDHVATEKIFDGVSYELGALLLCAIEREVGRSAFDALLRDWFHEAKGKAVDTDAFFAFVQGRAALDVAALRRRWVDALPSSEDVDGLVAAVSARHLSVVSAHTTR